MLTNRLLLGGRAKIPGIFVPARLHARCKPLRFDNRKIKQVLGWTPRYSLAEALDRSFADEADARPAEPVPPAPTRIAPRRRDRRRRAERRTSAVEGGGMSRR